MHTILVVDDSPVDRQIAARLLRQKAGFESEHAANGIEALEVMENHLPLAILADLQMPEMDGLELVRRVQQQYPTIPVVVMTAQGSEEIAMQALLAGAADYVPKSRLADDLPRAVHTVLNYRDGDHVQGHLNECLRYRELRYELRNDMLLAAPLAQQCQQWSQEMMALDATESYRLARSVLEALRNAICHGNLELPSDTFTQWTGRQGDPDDPVLLKAQTETCRDRRVHVHATFTPEEVRIQVADQGRGFDPRSLPDYRNQPMHLIEGKGRGLALIHVFMDEVNFSEDGRVVTMIKRRRG